MAKRKQKTAAAAQAAFNLHDYLTELKKASERSEALSNEFVHVDAAEETEQQSAFKRIYGDPKSVTMAIGNIKRTFKVYPVVPKRWYFALEYAAQGLLDHSANKLLDTYLASQQLVRKDLDKVPVEIWDAVAEADGLPEIIPPPPKAQALAKFGTNPICLDQTLLTKMDSVLQYLEASYQREDSGFRPPRLDGVAGTCKTQINALIAQCLGVPLVKVAGERSDPLTVQMKFGRANDRLVTNAVEAAKQVVSWGGLTSKKAERELFRTLKERGSYNRLTEADYQQIAELEGLKVGEPYLQPNEYAFSKQYGGYLFLDEVNYFDPTIISILNNELENKSPRVIRDDLTDRVQVHPNYVVSAAQNPASITYSMRDPLPFDLASRMVAIPEVPAPSADEIRDMLFFKLTGIQPMVKVNGVNKRFTAKDIGLEAKTYVGMPVINQLDSDQVLNLCAKLGRLHVAVYKESDQGVLSRMHQCEPTKEIEMQVSEPNAFSKRNIYDDFCTILGGEFFRKLPNQPKIPKQKATQVFLESISTAIQATYRSPNDFSRAVETKEDRAKPQYVSAAIHVDSLITALKLSPKDLSEQFGLKTPTVKVSSASFDTKFIHALIMSNPEISEEAISEHMKQIEGGLKEVAMVNNAFSAKLLKNELQLIAVDLDPKGTSNSLPFPLDLSDHTTQELLESAGISKDNAYYYYVATPTGGLSTHLLHIENEKWKTKQVAKSQQAPNWIENTLNIESLEPLPRMMTKSISLPGINGIYSEAGAPLSIWELDNSEALIQAWAERQISSNTPDI